VVVFSVDHFSMDVFSVDVFFPNTVLTAVASGIAGVWGKVGHTGSKGRAPVRSGGGAKPPSQIIHNLCS